MNETLYDRLITEVFRRHWTAGQSEFERDEMAGILREWGEHVRNLGDVIYSYRGGRRSLPPEIASSGNWVIEGRGQGRYAFRRLRRSPYVTMPEDLQAIDILDATPEIILRYGGSDEQGLLTRVRYNRLIDTFLGVTAYHMQGHIRTSLEHSGQIEIDDLYLGVDKDGSQYVIPVEAKTASEPLGVIQVTWLNAFGARRFPSLTLRAVAVKASPDGSLFFSEFNNATDSELVKVVGFRRYRLIRENDPHCVQSGHTEAANV